MKLLYKAYACEDLAGDGTGKVLLPGCPVQPDVQVRPGDRLRLEFADGTWATTVAVGVETVAIDESTATRFRRARRGIYRAAKVPRTFSHPDIGDGALVYLDFSLDDFGAHEA